MVDTVGFLAYWLDIEMTQQVCLVWNMATEISCQDEIFVSPEWTLKIANSRFILGDVPIIHTLWQSNMAMGNLMKSPINTIEVFMGKFVYKCLQKLITIIYYYHLLLSSIFYHLLLSSITINTYNLPLLSSIHGSCSLCFIAAGSTLDKWWRSHVRKNRGFGGLKGLCIWWFPEGSPRGDPHSDHFPIHCQYTLWWTNIAMERSTIFNGKIHYK